MGYFGLSELVGPPLAALTAAPGARLPAEVGSEQKLDQAMASIDQLRLGGKLDKLLLQARVPPAAGDAGESTAAAEPQRRAAAHR